MRRGLLVDLDGTLADSIACLKDVFMKFLQKHGIVGSDQEFTDYMGATLHEIIEGLKERHGLVPSPAELYQVYADEILTAYETKVPLMPGAEQALVDARQKGFNLALVTAASEELTLKFLQANRLEKSFDSIVCAKDGEPGKPDPALYKRACQVLQLHPNDCIAVEDSLNGVKSALDAGCGVFWLTRAEVEPGDSRVKVVKSWKEIREWLEETK